MRPSFDPAADADRDAQQWIADALGIELTDTQRLILADGAGNRLTLGKPVPVDRSHELTQSQRPRGADTHTVILDEPVTFRERLVDPYPDIIADSDGNPLPDGFRAELDAQLRLRAEFHYGAVRNRLYYGGIFTDR